MFVWKSYNALDHVSERTYDYATGNVLTEKNPGNIITGYTYDDFGNLTNKTISALGQTQSVAIGWTTGSRPLGSVYYKLITTSGSPSIKEYYDYLGKKLRTEATGFDGNIIYQSTVYNNKNQVAEISTPYKTGETSYKTLLIYDSYGRLERQESTSGITENEYSLKTTITTKGAQTTSTTIDSQGNNLSSSDNVASVNYSYKSFGKPATITSAGSSWSMGYDSYGRQTSLSDPDAGTTTYSYNNFGELLSQTDARDSTISNTYDNLGRILTQTMPEGTRTYHYDPSGLPGLLDYVEYPGGSEDYTYDVNGRLTSKVIQIDGANYTTSYTYGDYSRLDVLTYPSGFAIRNIYNDHGYNSEIKRVDNNQTIWIGTAMNAFGQFTQYQYGNSITTNRDFDHNGLLTSIYSSVQNLSYIFNPETGNLQSRKDNVRNLFETFAYDNVNRLIGINGPSSMTLTYSTNGNILSKTGIENYTYGGIQPHAVTNVDNTGALISTETQDITYTSSNKTDVITQGSLRYPITYGHDDQRTITRLYDNDVLQKTVHYVDGYEKEITPGSHTRQVHYIAGGNGLVAVFVRNDGLDTLYYVHTDHLGSINVITNGSGAVLRNYSFDAWGRRRNPEDWTYNDIPSTFLFARGFTGHEHLDDFDLINMNGRLYDPLLARFLGPDIFVQLPDFSQSFNRYGYCLNNPLIMTDPSGDKFNFWKALFFMPFGIVAIGPGMNWATGESTFGQALGRYAVNAASFIIGAGVGAGVSSALAGGSFFGGVMGTSTVVSTGFTSGFVSGAAGGFSGGFVNGFGNAAMNSNSQFGDMLSAGWNSGWKGAIFGGVAGGITGGIDAITHERDFFTGELKPRQNVLASVSDGNLSLNGEEMVSKENLNHFDTPLSNNSNVTSTYNDQITVNIPKDVRITGVRQYGDNYLTNVQLGKHVLTLTPTDKTGSILLYGYRYYKNPPLSSFRDLFHYRPR